MRRQSDDFYRSAHFHPSDPFDLFRTFFADHDPFHDPFLDPLDGFFSHHRHHGKHHHQDLFFPDQNFHSPNIQLSIFDDLPAGTTTCSTTFQTGDGGTVHITRTVIGGDGSVRREMRFRTPSTTRAHQEAEDGWSRHSSRARRQQSGRCEAEGRSRPRQPSRSAPQRERRGEPDGAPAGDRSQGQSQHKHHQHHHKHHHTQHHQHSQHSQYPQHAQYTQHSHDHQHPPQHPPRSHDHQHPQQSQHAKPRRTTGEVEGEKGWPGQGGSRRQQRHRSQVAGTRQRDSSSGPRRETRRRERSCEGSSLNTVYCPLCDGKFSP